MQQIQCDLSANDCAQSPFVGYSVRQRLLSASVSLAMTSSATVTYALANTAMPPMTPVVPASHLAHSVSSLPASHAWHNLHGSVFTAGLTHSVASAIGHNTIPFSASSTLHAASSAASIAHAWHAGTASTIPAFSNQTPTGKDVDLNSAVALFSTNSLAGFHTLTLDIGGKSQVINFNSKLTGAELVAVEQVLAGGKQQLTINASGIATGGVFSLNSVTLAQLDSAVGGNLGSLSISHGVKAIDSLSNLSLLGSLVNMGSIVVAADSGSKGQTNDVISAANIYNAGGGVISSVTAGGGLLPAGITLTTPGLFVNSGTISSSSVLNISAPTINNTATSTGAGATMPQLTAHQNVNLSTSSLTNGGLISSATGNVNIVNSGAGDLNVNGVGGTVQAVKGDINFNASGYSGSDNITVSGGNWLSQQVNLNAGTGAINVNVGQLTGVVNGTASSSHVTADTSALQLGAIDTTGDPTYFNTGGDVIIDGSFGATGGADLAIVASGNIIGNGGALDTHSTSADGGSLTLIAGAFFTTSPSKGSGQMGPDSSTTLTVTDSGGKNGSAGGGYIDLSGIVLTPSPSTNKAVTTIDTSSPVGKGGNVLMVAYEGTELNSGSIVASAVPANGTQPAQPGSTLINATGATPAQSGNVTIIGGGSTVNNFILGQDITAGSVNIWAGNPTVGGGSLQILDGKITTGSYSQPLAPTFNFIAFGNIVTPGGNVVMSSSSDVQTNNIITAGVGGTANTAGQSGGNVTITALGIAASTIDASGGGGGGGNPGASGGAGGKGGNVSLTASTDGLFIEGLDFLGYVNVSGGGGGGGGGGGDAGSAGVGGNGGKAGTITLATTGPFEAGQIYAFDGGAGAAGNAATAGATGSGGGGGGGGGGYGGGGGGGAAGTIKANALGSAVGGGGGGGILGGGGGGGTTGADVATAGTGGSASGLVNPAPGSGGTGTVPGAPGAPASDKTNAGGAGGSPINPTTSGAGGTFAAGGQGGTDTNAIVMPTNNGASAAVVAGDGSVQLALGTTTFTSAKAPLEVDTASLSITSNLASVFITTLGDVLDVSSAALLGAKSTLSIVGVTNPFTATTGTINVSGVVTAPTVIINSASTLTSTGKGSVNGATATLTAAGNISINTAVNTLTVAGGGTSVSVNESASSAKVLTLLASSVGATGTFSLSSTEQINVTKAITATNGNINLAETGGTSTIGINITPALNVGTGSISLSTTGGTASIAAAGLLTAKNLTITADGTVGLSTKPLSTNISNQITVTGNSANGIYLKDANKATLNVGGTSTALGQTFSLVSAAQTLNISQLAFSNVTVNDTFSTTGKGAVVALDPAAAGLLIGDGTGTVTITAAAASINQGASGKSVIDAAKAVLTSSGGDVGGTGLIVTAPVLTVTAPKGLVNVQDLSTSTITLNAGSALNNYTVNASATNLTVAGAINGGQIALTASGSLTLNANVGSTKSTVVTLDGETGITQNAKAVTTGIAVSLLTNTGDIGSKTQSILTKATSTLAINGKSGTNNAFVNQTGKVTLAASSNTSITTGSLTLVDSGNLTTSDTIQFGSITLTTPVLEVGGGAGKGIVADNLFVTAPVIKFDALTASGGDAWTLTSNGALSITGTGSVGVVGSMTLGTLVSGKGTTSITLGDAKTGAGNPISGSLGMLGPTNATGISQITIATKGNFSVALGALTSFNGIATDQTGAAGKLSITAANIVNLNSATLNAPIILAANALTTSGSVGGTVSLTLTGTQAVTVSGSPSTGKIPAPYLLQANGGTTGAATAGSIAVSTGGLLTVNSGGIALGTIGHQAGSLSLASNKNLSVTAAGILDATAGLANVSLSSGGTVPFVVDAGVAPVPVNGTAGAIVATTSSSFANPFGALTLLTTAGNDDSITPGSALTLTAKTGITLGDAKNFGANNPLKSIGNSILDNLTINTGGNFSYNFDFAGTNTLTLLGSPLGSKLSVTAGNIVNLSQSTALAPIVMSAPALGGKAGTILLTTTGTQAITLGNVNVTKGTPQFELSTTGGTFQGTVDVKTAGALTVNSGGVIFNGPGNNLTLNGAKSLAVTDGSLLNTNLATLSLTSGAAAPFVIGAPGTFTNGTAGNLQAGTVAVTDVKGITVNSSITATGASVTLDTAAFLNSGTVSGSGSSSLIFSDPGKNNLGVVSGGIGTYSGFAILGFGTQGAVNVGDLITSTKSLDAGLLVVDITSGGILTFGSANPGINVPSGGLIVQISAASFAASGTSPITINAPVSSVTITSKAALTAGTLKGNVDLVVGAGTSLILASTAGTLTVAEPLTFGNGNLSGSSVVINKAVSGSGAVSVLALGKTGTLTSGTGGVVSGTLVTVGQGNTKLSKAAFNVSSASVLLGSVGAAGALNLSNAVAGGVSEFVPISALSYTSTAAGNTNVGIITTTAGGITISSTAGSLSTATGANLQTTGGGISLIVGSAGTNINIGNNSNFSTTSGSILVQDNNVGTGQIKIGTGVNMHASGTAKGVGQVSIVIGPVPTTPANGLVPGPTPTPAPIVNANNGGGVFYGTNGITTAGANTLNAFGRNVVFNTASAANIQLAGGDTITADPPDGAVNSVALPSVANPLVIVAPLTPVGSLLAAPISLSPTVSPTVSLGQALTGVSATAGLNGLAGINNLAGFSSLAGIGGIAASNMNGESSNVDALNDIAALSSLNVAAESQSQSADDSLPLTSGTRRLSAKVSNIETKSLQRGSLLLSPQVQTVVQTDFGSVSVAAKSVALILAFDGGVAVYNLHDSRKDAVVVNCGSHTISLAPGQNTVMTNRHVRFFEEINPAQRVAYRRMVSRESADGLKSFRSEFNIISMLQGYEPLAQFVRSADPEKRKVSQAMLKTAAILMGLSGAEPFEYMVARPVTALNTARGN